MPSLYLPPGTKAPPDPPGVPRQLTLKLTLPSAQGSTVVFYKITFREKQEHQVARFLCGRQPPMSPAMAWPEGAGEKGTAGLPVNPLPRVFWPAPSAPMSVDSSPLCGKLVKHDDQAGH